MKYSITIEIGKDRYGYDAVKSEVTMDVEGLPQSALEELIRAMVIDAEKKSLRKFKGDTKTEGAAPPAMPKVKEEEEIF